MPWLLPPAPAKTLWGTWHPVIFYFLWVGEGFVPAVLWAALQLLPHPY